MLGLRFFCKVQEWRNPTIDRTVFKRESHLCQNQSHPFCHKFKNPATSLCLSELLALINGSSEDKLSTLKLNTLFTIIIENNSTQKSFSA